MLADLVEVTTPEGIVLSGAYFAPINVGRSYSVDAVLFFHGDGGHFYSSLYLWLGQRMAEQGIAFLTANRRGHDHVAFRPERCEGRPARRLRLRVGR